MIVKVTGWYTADPWVPPFYARVRATTEEAQTDPYSESIARRLLVEHINNEAGLIEDASTFTWRDLADDETVPEEDRIYRYYEMQSIP